MLFSKSSVVRFQMVVLVSSVLLIAGCVSALPENEMPIASETVEEAAPQTGIEVDDAAADVANEMSDQQALADYQFRQSDNFGSVVPRESVAIEAAPNQIPDQQALADYQFRQSDNFGSVVPHESIAVEVAPNQIPDQQALAEFQLQLSETGSGQTGNYERIVVNETSPDMVDRQALADYQFQLSGNNLDPVTDGTPVDAVSNQMEDRQSLADYHLR